MSDLALPALLVEPLERAAFAPFGEVIEAGSARRVLSINQGTAQRYHDLARIDCSRDGGRSVISLFRAQPRPLPFVVQMLERHPLGSQAFIPLDPTLAYLVVVASAIAATPRAFYAAHGLGVNFAAGVWHHPLLALDRVSDFLVIDRDGPGDNCDEATLPQAWLLDRPASPVP